MTFEVREYWDCDCGEEYCRGEKERLLFEHEMIGECRDFMLKFARENALCYKINHCNEDKNALDIHIQTLGGLKSIRKLRVRMYEGRNYGNLLKLSEGTFSLNKSKLSKKIKVPVSTVFDWWKRLKKTNEVEAIILVNGKEFCRSEVD